MAESNSLPQIIGITPGDPSGIGPEILQKSLLKTLRKLRSQIRILAPPSLFEHPEIQKLCLPDEYFADLKDAGAIALRSLQISVRMALAKQIQGIVNGPLNKAVIARYEPGFKGHTAYYDQHISATGALMAFYGSHFCLGLLTDHLPLNQVSAHLLKQDMESLIRRFILEFTSVLQKKPFTVVLGFNPHAGEDGLLSMGEETVLVQAVRNLANSGFSIHGPVSPDGFFARFEPQKADLLIACYHDQGLIPFKMLHAPGGVSLTFGLKIPRATVDHGPAYELYAQNKADFQSMEEAILLMDQILHQKINSAIVE